MENDLQDEDITDNDDANNIRKPVKIIMLHFRLRKNCGKNPAKIHSKRILGNKK